MRKYDGRTVGLLGTLIIHLIAAIIFMSFKIREIKRPLTDTFSVELAPAEEAIADERLITLPMSPVERIPQADDDMLNIARNLASKSDQTINPDDYIDMVKEELIKSGQLGKDNYIDEQKKQPETGDEEISSGVEKEKTAEQAKPKVSQEMAANYKGPTRIYYNLEGRNHSYLPVPIYMCKGSGKVALSIDVNQKGIVEDAKVIGGESTTDDECLIETAISTALISKFNPDVNAPRLQRGTLTYHFVAQ